MEKTVKGLILTRIDTTEFWINVFTKLGLSKVGKARKYLKSQELMQDDHFRYMLLSRMKGDCDVYLGESPQRLHASRLWALEEKEHITIMKNLYLSFPNSKKPKWISMDEIETYENQMLAAINC